MESSASSRCEHFRSVSSIPRAPEALVGGLRVAVAPPGGAQAIFRNRSSLLATVLSRDRPSCGTVE
eukprot:3815102-Alexandrium_andersonii.AAC.1